MLTRPDRRARAMTLVELIFAVTIMALTTGVMIGLLVKVLQQERANSVRVRMAYDAANLHRELRQFASVGGVDNTVINPDNTSVTFTNSLTGITSQLIYVDGDDDNNTIDDNFIQLIPDISNASDRNTVVRYVSVIDPSDTSAQNLDDVFSRTGSFNNPLVVNFRIGDRVGGITDPGDRAQNAQAAAEDAQTGRGFQSILFRGAYGNRNRI